MRPDPECILGQIGAASADGCPQPRQPRGPGQAQQTVKHKYQGPKAGQQVQRNQPAQTSAREEHGKACVPWRCRCRETRGRGVEKGGAGIHVEQLGRYRQAIQIRDQQHALPYRMHGHHIVGLIDGKDPRHDQTPQQDEYDDGESPARPARMRLQTVEPMACGRAHRWVRFRVQSAGFLSLRLLG